jgi:hypothetical protein
MPDQEKGKGASERQGEAPRTDLPPTREPYDEGYFGTGDEEEVVRESEEVREKKIPDDAAEKRTPKGEDL